jgi:uncharacterized protein YegL
MMVDDSMETGNIGGTQAFQFSATRIEHLGATEYTLATLAVDVTGSVEDFAADMTKAVRTVLDSCKKSPRANNLMVRLILFSTSQRPTGINEIHGFKPLGEIDPSQYPELIKYTDPVPANKPYVRVYGSTNLFDASYSAVGATNAYAKKLMDQEFLANGIVFIITDGDDNASSATMRMIRDEMDRATKGEEIESLIGILIGVNATNYAPELAKFAATSGLKFVDIGDATAGKLAKLADFVSQSVSSQSQALGTGGPSQNIAATI